ncbi:MAG: protein kinase [Polyangiaceae bacterium]
MRRVGRYELWDEFASGGMASIHFGRLHGASGFSKVVAIKRLHPQFARDPDFVAMFVEEARVAGRVQHPNVVGVRDVVREGEELFLVMDYVHAEPLSALLRESVARGQKVPPAVAAGVLAQALRGLHAAHEATSDRGEPLGIVHRDVSPQNILVGDDGVARVADFGVAKALGRALQTAEGSFKGKVAYFAPEQLKNEVDRRTDVFAAGIVLWEALLGARLFAADTHWAIVEHVLRTPIARPDATDPDIPPALSDLVMQSLERDPERRFPTARAMATAIEKAGLAAPNTVIAEWVVGLRGEVLDARLARRGVVEAAVASPVPVELPREREGAEGNHPERSPALLGASAPPPTPPRRAGVSTGVVIGAVAVAVAGVAFGVGSRLWSRSSEPPSSSTLVADARGVVSADHDAPRSAEPLLAPRSPSVVASPSAAPPSSGSSLPKAPSKPSRPPNYCDETTLCPQGLGCWSNVCQPCPPMQAGCGGRCVSILVDPNCGGCGINCASMRLSCVDRHCEADPPNR